MRRALALLLTALALTTSAQDELPEEKHFKVYPLGAADPFSSEQAVKAIVGEEGNVVIDPKNNRLLVNTTSNRHQRIRGLLGELTEPPKNVRIDVVFAGSGTDREVGAAVHGRGDVVFGPGGTDASIRLDPSIKHQVTQTSSHVTQSLLVASGRTGTLTVGEEVPYMEWLVEYGRRYGYIQQGVARWQRVGSRLVVEPTVLADGAMIRVRLTPELSGYVDGELLRTQFARVATEVTVANGQSFSIGGLNKDESFYSRFLIGFDRAGSQKTLDITLTPRILEAPGSAPKN